MRARACLGWIGVLSVIGCDGGGVVPETDAGMMIEGDAGTIVEEDAGTDAGPVTGCRSHGECEDGDRCTENTCLEGECWARLFPGCSECASDADCDDGFECTIDQCFGGVCNWEWSSATCECEDASHCDDFDASTTDRCVDHLCVHDRRTCTGNTECDDGVSCTDDVCESGFCSNVRTIRCDSSCPDSDADGHGSRWCFGGDDCDDFNPAIHPGAAEVCSDGVDNDCDGRIDRVDDACGTGGTTCESARLLTPGTPLEGAILSDRTSGTPERMPCGTANYFTIVLAETSDVDVTVTLEEPPPPTPVPGCPECTSDRMWEYWYRIFFERTCGDTASDLGGGGAWCRTWSDGGFFGGSGTETLRLRRVPAGTYTIELQGRDQWAWMPVAIEYTISATVMPSAAPMCGGAVVLAEGTTVRGNTGAGTNAFGTDCSGAVADLPEAIHRFALTERRRVRLEAVGVADATTGAIPALRLGLYGMCDPASARTDCLEHTGGDCHPRTTFERILDPGEHWLIVESASITAAYDLTLRTEPVGAACADAPVIAASGSWSGNTAGAPDAFRDHRVCGDGYAPDTVYRVDVAVPSRVVLDLIASYDGEMLTLYRGCAEARHAGGRTSTRVDTTLEPGTYYAVIGGARPENAGSYVLNATFVPTDG